MKCVHSDPSDLSSPCLRCLKGKKDCVFDLGGRRRNKPNQASSSTSLHRVNSDASVHKDQYKYKHSSGTIYGNGAQQPAQPRSVLHSGFPVTTGISGGGNLDFSTGSYDGNEEISLHQFGMSDSSVESPMVKGKGTNVAPSFSPPSDEASPDNQQRQYAAFPRVAASQSSTASPGMPHLSMGEHRANSANIDGLQQTISARGSESNVPPHQQLLPHQSLFVDAIPMDQFRTYKMANPVNVMAIRDQMLAAWQKLTDRDAKRMRSYDGMGVKFLSVPTDKTIVELGIITKEEAQQRIDCYKNFIYPLVPIISVGNATVEELMADRPLIFNTIMDITSRYIEDEDAVETSMRIHNVAYLNLVKEVFVYSNKTLESFLALLLHIYFYNEPEFYHRTRMYSLTATATSLAFDLGLGVAPISTNGENYELPRYEQIVTPHILVDSTNEVCYKAWVASYSAMFNVLLSLRRPTPDLWNNYTRDAIGYLLRQGDPKCVMIAKHAEYVHLHFEITERLFRKDNDSDVQSMTSPGTLYLISQFDQEIERLKKLKPTSDHSSQRYMYLSTRAFLHQGVLYTNYSKQFGRTPFTNFSLNVAAPSLSPEAARSFKICYEAAVGAVRTLMELPRDKFLFLPTPMLAQLVFNAGLILKCRALVMVNKVYSDAIGVPTDFIDDVSDAAAALDGICAAYPFSNMTLCLSFVIKLLMCHNDAVIHHIATKYSYNPDIIIPQTNESPDEPEEETPQDNSITNGTSLLNDEGLLPPHPKSAFKEAPLVTSEYLVAPDEEVIAQNRRTSAVSFEGENLLRNTHLFPSEMEFDGEHPFWQMSEDFWKGVFPAESGMSIDL